MKEHIYDKSRWRKGVWDQEPDRLEWREEGFPCLIVRNSSGALCGYVGVPPGSPYHGLDYDDVDISVHGGLTYAQGCDEDSPICHVPLAGEPDNVWWLGFDCLHSGDLAPDFGFGTYKDISFVKQEISGMIEQLRGSNNGR
jgi:hypothetical protein